MKRTTRIALTAALPLLLISARAQAGFEGVIESRMTMAGQQKPTEGSVTAKTYVSNAGARMEMTFAGPQGSMKMTSLQLVSRPGLVYMVNDSRKSYTEVDTAKLAANVKAEERKYTVKKVGKEAVLGYSCDHAIVSNDKGEEWEMWVTKEIGGWEAFWAAQRGRGRSGMEGLGKALQDSDIRGWPMKMVIRAKDRESAGTWEVTKVDKKSLPSSLFEIPAGYTKSEDTGLMGMMGQMELPPEQQKQLDEAMKKQEEMLKSMTPEQRKQYEEMMKAFGAQPKK